MKIPDVLFLIINPLMRFLANVIENDPDRTRDRIQRNIHIDVIESAFKALSLPGLS